MNIHLTKLTQAINIVNHTESASWDGIVYYSSKRQISSTDGITVYTEVRQSSISL